MFTEETIRQGGSICISSPRNLFPENCRYYYLSQIGDTMGDILDILVKNNSMQSINACISALIAANSENPMVLDSLSNVGSPMFEHTMVAIPLSCLHTKQKKAYKDDFPDIDMQYGVRKHNDLFITHREFVAKAITLGYGPTLAAVNQFVVKMNEYHKQYAMTGVIGLSSLEQTGEYYEKQYDKFLEQANHLNKQLIEYIKSPLENKRPTRESLVKSYHELNHNFGKMINHLAAKYPGHGAAKFVKLQDMVKNVDSELLDTHILTGKELEFIGKGMKRAKYLGRHAMAFEVALGGMDVYSAYEEGEDWHKALAEVMAEIGGGVVGSYLADFGIGLILNPFTGMAIIVIAFDVAGSIVISQILKIITEKYYSRTQGNT